MLRTKEWKYVHRYPDGPDELYHLERDPGETENLVASIEAKEVGDSMKSRLDVWFERYVCPELDGSKQFDCQGRGQLDRVTARAGGAPVFNPRHLGQ